MITQKPKILPLKDEEGNYLPKNMSRQFRKIQSGIADLKIAAEDSTADLKP